MQNRSASLPRGVQIFIVAHLLAVAVMGMAAALLGETCEGTLSEYGDPMHLVPLTIEQPPPALNGTVGPKGLSFQMSKSPLNHLANSVAMP